MFIDDAIVLSLLMYVIMDLWMLELYTEEQFSFLRWTDIIVASCYVADFNLGFFLCGLFIPLGFCPLRFFPDPCRASRDPNLVVCIHFGPRQPDCNFLLLDD